MDIPTRLDLYAIGRDRVVQRAKKIDPFQVDVAGSDVNIIVGSGSVLAYAVVKQLLYRVQSLLLDGAFDEDLDRYAWDRYQLVRKGASPAVGTVRFYRDNGVAGGGSVPIGTKLRSLTGAEYITTTEATFSSGSVLFATAAVRATQAGKATQVGANQIRQISNPQPLFDGTLKVNNDLTTAGGENTEDDDTFKARVRDFWSTARRGILAAIEFGAKTVPGVVSAQAVEALTGDGQPARVVNLYIADSSGVASEALARAVLVALNEYRAAGIAVIVFTSLPQLVDVQLALRFVANVDTLTLADEVRAAVVEFINSLPVNGTLLLGDLYSVLQRFRADGLIASQDSIVAPAGDLVPGPGQTIRTTLDRVQVV